MKNLNNYVSALAVSSAFAILPISIPCYSQALGQTSEVAPKDLSAERVQALVQEDPGILPQGDIERFANDTFAQAAAAHLKILSASRVTSQTGGLVCERQQALALEATGPELLNFLQSLAESNSVLRVRELAMRPTPDRSRLAAKVLIVGHYRLQPGAEQKTAESLKTDYQLLKGRGNQRYAALACYRLASEGLPPGWRLESLVFEGGKQLSLKGQAPADQVSSLEDVRTRLQATKGHGEEDLFRPSASQATMQMVEPARTNFSWTIELGLRAGTVR